ncbi:MAG: hypothetical protein JRI91_11245 [Deltaproteobacteria bacterium]|nr:hypothetical protein [Deltaproteobacteria bacterium]
MSELEDISDNEIDYFTQRLQNLKQESISAACRNLIQRYLGNAEALTYKRCYDVRSQLVHDGTIKDGINIVDYHHKLDSLSNKLLYAIINKKPKISR